MSEVTMPQLGESVTEGTITRWFKQPGDEIAEDEILLEVSTDKVDTEVPSPVAGTLQELRVEEGDTVDVGTVIAVIGEGAAAAGESAGSEPAVDATGGDGTADTPSEGRAADASTPPPPAQPSAASAQPSEPAAANDAAQPEAAAQPVDAPQAHGGPSGRPAPEASGPPERQAEAPSAESAPPSAPAQDAPSGAAASNAGTLLSPQVRRLLADANLAASEVTGTGVGGRITRQDALGAIEAAKRTGAAGAEAVGTGPPPGATPAPTGPQAAPQPSPAAAQPAAAAPGSPAAAQPAAAARGSSVPTPAPVALGAGDTEVPFSNIRRRTGEHMVASKATSPHVITAVEVDYEAVEAARQQFGAEYKASEGHSLTYLPFIARAAVDAMSDFPFINASVDGDSLVVHRDVNLSVAVDLNFEGLLAPVVRQASDKRLHAIARDIADLAQRARAKQLSPDDLVGGTFTLSNSGSFGALFVAPVINQPQVAILSTDGISRRPVAVSDGRGHESIAIHSVGNLTMSWDHRAFDGAYAAAFLARMKEILQTRDWAAEL